MNGDSPVSWLMFFTLVAGLAIITGAFLMFLRSGRNRDIAADTLTGDNRSSAGPAGNGALPDLIAIAVFAAIAMGLLAVGYNQKSSFETAQAPGPVGKTSSGTSGMAQSPGRADQPKNYQPVNPVPDNRTSPTGSASGVGPDSGGRPEQQPAAK